MSTISEETRRQDVREAILTTALDLIHEKGVNSLSLREIARCIRYSPAGLYEYFDSKAAIIQAVRLRALMRFHQLLVQEVDDSSYPEGIVQLGLAYVRFASRYPQEFLLLFTELRGEIEEAAAETEMSQKSYRLLLDRVQQAIDDGFIDTRRDLFASEAAFAFWSLVHGAAMLQVSYRRELDLEVEQATRLALHALAVGMMPR